VTGMSRLPMRTALETLRLEFPLYAITMRTVGDKMFYLAEATSSHVQPRFAQAETTDRLRAKLSTRVREFTTTEPSIPRVWDVLLGGKDNFATDREQAGKLLSVFPKAGELARESREFQRRAVTLAANAGVRQFLDIGCGLPISPATHEVAQQVQPGSVVVYADNDELVMSHAQNLLARAPGVVAVAGDLAHPDEILYDWRVRQVLDFRQPIAVVLTMALHFFDAETARTICARLIDGIAPGSYLIISAGHLDGPIGQQFTAEYRAGHLHHHTREDIAGFLAGLELIKPGITEARAWRAPVLLTGQPAQGHIWAALARKPGPGTARQL
jgi:S-adenosyl methyltransferase